MQNFLRTMMLAALMLLPFASKAQSLPFEETFSGSSAPTGWTMYTGLVDQAFAGTAPSSATYGWNFGSNNGLTNSHARVNIYGTSCYKWLVTPTIDLTNATTAQLSFDLAFTAFSGSNPANVTNVADDKFMVIISTDNGQTWSAANATKWMIADSVTAGVADYDLTALPYSSFQNFVINLNAYLGDSIKIAFYGESTVSGGDNNLHIDNVLVEEIPACPPVTGLVVSNVTANGATISWIGDADGYTIYDMSDTTVYEYAIDTTADLYALDPNTQYTFGVAANCGSDESALRTVSFRTSCAPYSLPFSENFSASLSDDPCWRGANVLYAEDTSVNMTNNNVWTHASSLSNGIEAGHYRVNIYGSSCTKWIITPEIDLGSASSPLLSFDAVFTAYSGTSAASGFESNSSQAFKVLVTTDGGQSWSVASNISLSGIAGTTYVPQYVDLSNYAGDTVRVAFYAQSTQSGGDNNLHLDNILIEESTGSICYPASNLTVSDVTTDGATLNWVGTASSYNVYVITATDTTFAENVSDTTVTLTNLNPMTAYTYGVTADCGDNESIITSISFTTSCTAVELPYTETFESTSGTRSCWTIVGDNANMGGSNGAGFVTLNGRETMRFSSYSNASNYDQYGYSPTLDVDASATNLSVSVVYATYGSNDNLYFGYITATDTIWDPTAYTTSGQNDWQSHTFVIPATATQLAVHYFGDYSYYAWIDSVVVTAMEGDYCAPVAALTVDSASTTSISLSWNSDANNFTIIDMSDNSVVATSVDNYVTVSGLTASTSYTFGVVVDCGSATSDTVTIATMTQCESTCQITIAVTDSYGDGWDNSTLIISQNGATQASINMLGQGVYNTPIFDTFQVTVCSGTPVAFSWSSGSNYDNEAGFDIIDGGNAVAYTVTDASTLTSGAVFYTLNDACPNCVSPVVSLDAVTETGATISWTGNATSFNVYNGSTFVANTTANTYTFTGLNAATAYTVGVVAVCGTDDSSSMATVSFTTECGSTAINLPFNETFDVTSGTRNCWTLVDGDNDGNNWTTLYNGQDMGMMLSFSYDNATYADITPNNWLISPKLHSTAGSSVTMTWDVNAGNDSYFSEHYGVYVSTTTTDTSAFTLVNEWTLTSSTAQSMNLDLSAYAGQDIYVAFRHFNCTGQLVLILDNVNVYEGVYVPDTLTVVVATQNAAMGTTNPVPGTYQYAETETVSLSAIPNNGYHFIGWAYNVGSESDTLTDEYISLSFPANAFIDEGVVTFTALFEAGNPDSIAVTYAVNDPTMGTIVPAPGTYAAYVGSSIQTTALANTGYQLDGWVIGFYGSDNSELQVDTIYSDDTQFANPMNFGSVPQNFADNGITITITALFGIDTTGTTDSLFTLITAVNDATMGTITPAPGTYTYAAGDSVVFDFTAAEGYTIGSVDVTLSYRGVTLIDTTFPGIIAIGMAATPLDADAFLGMTMSLTVNFVPDTAISSDVFTVITAVNNPSMGTITPAPGTHTYNVGDVINFSATPNEGYAFENAVFAVSYMGITLAADTATTFEEFNHLYEVDSVFLGYTMTVTVNFIATQGIEAADEVNINAYSKDGNVILSGAEGREVYLFDINGRMLHHTQSANTTETYSVPANGVYLIKVKGAQTKRVVVIR